MTVSNATASRRVDTRHETKVAPNLYRQGSSDRYRFARMKDGVSVFERFTAPTLTEAKAHANELRTKDVSAFGDKSVTVEALAASYLERESGPHAKIAASTLAVRRYLLNGHVVPTLGPKTKAVDITPAHLRRMIDKLNAKELAGASVRSCVSSASAMFKHGVKDLNAIPRNPCRDLEHGDRPSAQRQTEPRYLSVQEVGKLLGKMSDESRPVAAACFWAALRVSEALRLRWADIDFDQAIIAVPGSKTVASKAPVPLHPALADELRAHRKRQGALGFDRIASDALVFQTATGRSPGRRNVLRAVTNAGKRAGLQPEGTEPIGVHDLRHSLAGVARELPDMTDADLTRLLRHANEYVTKTIYGGRPGTQEAQAQSIGGKLAGIGGTS